MTNETESGQELNATQLDARRARHLLDRALGLAERNDVAGAIVICRQSLVLAPNSPQGWSMLGLLHERDGDIQGAIEAYEKTLQLSPGSVLERESLQRLRQKRGAAPRPAPKFNFGEIINNTPQAPSTPTPQPAIPQQIEPEPFDTDSTVSLWDTFYFRSLPVLVTAIACLGLILVAQRVAENHQAQNMQIAPVVPATVEVSPEMSTQPDPVITPNTLAPPTAPPTQAGQVSSSEPASATSEQTAPAPIATPKTPATSRPKPAAKPKPKPQSRPAPRPAVPSEMPVLPAPRLTLPKRSAPAPAVPNHDTNDDPATINGGPVDVGNSDDSKYIPINPPHFPNASRS